MRSHTSALAVVLILATSQTVFAQVTSPRLEAYVSRRVAPHESFHSHSSTAYEGARRGEASWISAYGDFLVDESKAALVWEHVESKHYDNTLKKTATALARKQMLEEYREYQRELKQGRREAGKQLMEKKYLDLAHTYRLDQFEFNWETGAIAWPSLVAGPRYAQHRKKIAWLMDRTVHYRMADDRFLRDEIARACQEFRDQLRQEAAEDHPSAQDEYLAMQRFLLGLKYSPYLMANTSMRDHHLASNFH